MNRQQVVDAINWDAAMSAERCAYGHVEVMDVMFRGASVIATWVDEDSYRGDVAYAYEFADGTVAIVTDSFGSCSGCDSWVDATEDEARAMIHELASSARLFENRESAAVFCERDAGQPEHYLFSSAANLVGQLRGEAN